MSGWRASAPGKLVLLGEYAVLEGAPAVVLAVNRRAKAEIRPRRDGSCILETAQPDRSGVRFRIRHGQPEWPAAAGSQAASSLVDHLLREHLRTFPESRLQQGADLYLDTSRFFDRNGAGHDKLGLGSSAALTVAFTAALQAFEHDRQMTPRQNALIRSHRDWQGGRGSGVDIAASLNGGLVRFTKNGPHEQPLCEPLPWPKHGLHLLFVWSGQSVSTSQYLRRLQQWQSESPAAHARHMQALCELAAAGAQALPQDPEQFFEIASRYGLAMQALARASGLEIFTSRQRSLAAWAASRGLACKPCGAGGDFAMLLARSAEALENARHSMMSAGFQVSDLQPAQAGLQCSPVVDAEESAAGR